MEQKWNDEQLLALGILPEGWDCLEPGGDSFEYVYREDFTVISESGRDVGVSSRVLMWVGRGPSADRPSIEASADYWPDAVSTGRAAEACAIMAAHVELERRRGGGK